MQDEISFICACTLRERGGEEREREGDREMKAKWNYLGEEESLGTWAEEAIRIYVHEYITVKPGILHPNFKIH